MPVMDETEVMVHTLIAPSLLERVDDFRFAHRFPSRAATMRYLLGWAAQNAPAPSTPPARQE